MPCVSTQITSLVVLHLNLIFKQNLNAMNKLDIIKNKIVTKKEDAFGLLQMWRFKDEKIVFTNGCFDIVHRGHLEYLALAASLGNKLIIGLNTDASVQELKGPTRPINDEYSRALLLASMGFVDMVIFFSEETPYDLIKFVQPDILVKGSDYKAEGHCRLRHCKGKRRRDQNSGFH